MKRIRIENGRIIPITTEREFIGTIGIEGNRIVMVSEDPNAPFEADEVIDATDKIVMPGMINAHTHASMTLFRGYADDMDLMDWLENKIWPIEARLDSEDIYSGTQLAIAEMIASGTTSYVDMYWDLDASSRAISESGIRAFLSMSVMDNNIERIERTADDLVSRHNNSIDGRLKVLIAPHAPYTCNPETLSRAMALADKYNLMVHTHISETEFEVNSCKENYGVDPVDYYEKAGLFSRKCLAAHGVYLTSENLDKLAKYGVTIVHNPISNMKLASGAAPVAEMIKHEVNVALGTDGASSNNNLDMFEEMRVAALLSKMMTKNPKSLTAYEAIRMATMGGAKAVGMENEMGEIREGYIADIILIDAKQTHLNPIHNAIAALVYAGKGSDVSDVIIDGNILMKDKKLLTVDTQEAIRYANERINNLTR